MRREASTATLPREPTPDFLLRNRPEALPRDRFPWSPSLEGLRAAAAGARESAADRAAVVSSLVASCLAAGQPAAADMARRLKHPESLVVMTGQQPGLFGGPLLVFAKAAGAVLLARRLEAFLGVPVVPIFWNLSEDHDLQEVNRLELFEGARLVRYEAPVSGGGRCLDHIEVGAEVVAFSQEALSRIPGAREIPELVAREGERWPEWSARCLRVLLPGLPLVQAEPISLRPLLGPFFAAALEKAERIQQALTQGTRAMEERGFHRQVKSRDTSQLFLVETDGRRRRILMDGGWRLEPAHEGDLSGDTLRDDLVRRAATAPGAFSTNVVLRPLAQQVLFPVVAHVNGPAEIAYFGQYPEVFAALGLPLPAVIPRPSLTLLREKEDRARHALGLAGPEVLADPTRWPEPAVDVGQEELFRRIDQRLQEAAQEARQEAGNPGVARAVEAFAKRLEEARKRLEETFRKDRDRGSEVSRERRRRLAEWIRPRGRGQERVLGPLVLLAGQDPRILGKVLGGLDPLDLRHQVVTVEEGDEAV